MKPSIPQGTRDFGPEVVYKRRFIFEQARRVFELYGFQPLETPAMENLDTLMGKYGDEGDQLIFKILNNGLDHPSKAESVDEGVQKIKEGKSSKAITERALKYDLTIPFARFVAMNHGKLNFPFKRYQIQPVWRADRPQRGRYREFFQCDADVVGSPSLINEIDFINIYKEVFEKLGITRFKIHINNRKLLTALAEQCGGLEFLTAITVAIDKLDKIGIEKVKLELSDRGLNEEQVSRIDSYLSISGSSKEKLAALEQLFENSEAGKKGLEELNFVLFRSGATAEVDNPVVLDLTLARGLNYYTGTIFEVKAPPEVKIGSIGGGGRYDDLTGLFGLPGMTGVGISFGIDRIYDVMEELDVFPAAIEQTTKALFLNLGEEESRMAYQQLQDLRKEGIAAEIYHEPAKFDKQFKYAERKNIPFVIIIGSKELASKQAVIKELATGQQKTVELANLTSFSFI